MSTQPKTLTVGLFPYLPSWNENGNEVKLINLIKDVLPTQVSGYNIEYTEFDCYSDASLQSLPDVFSTDSIFLPYLVSLGGVKSLDESLVRGVTGDLHSFVSSSASVNGSVYGFPQYLCSNFLLSSPNATQQASSLLELAQKVGYEQIVYPDVASSSSFTVFGLYQQLLQSSSSAAVDIKASDLPQSGDQVNKDITQKYRTILDSTVVASQREYINSVKQGKPISNYYVGYSESMCEIKDIIRDQQYNVQLIGTSDKPYVYTDVLALNSNLCDEKQKVAVEVIKNLLTNTLVLDLLGLGLTLPANKNGIAHLAKSSNFYAQLSQQFDAKESEVRVLRCVDFANKEVKNCAGVLRPFLQHIAVATLRCLTADTVEKAKSGHPGMPIGMSPIAYVLWKFFFKSSKDDVNWLNRDRFVLSNGHGCTLLYAMLHLTDCNLSLDDLKNFRSLHSKTPGHPEYGHTEGVDATTGPLGQGVCNAIGMALSEAHLAARFNKDGQNIFDHHTYVFLGDGCLMEGVAMEGLSFAGHQKLNKLIVFYDDNSITIDGKTELTFTQNTPEVMRGFGWHVIVVDKADNDLVGIKEAILEAHTVTDKPIMIVCKTTIGYSSKVQGTAKVHGSPLGADGLKNLKETCGFTGNDFFHVPEIVRKDFATVINRNSEKLSQWKQVKSAYDTTHATESQLLQRMINHELEGDVMEKLPKYLEQKKIATRSTSQQVLNAIYPLIPSLVGGSADLTPSNLTDVTGCQDFQPNNRVGRYIRFGVREHAMVAIANGILYHGVLRTYVGTFLNFASYALGAIRLSALSGLPNIYVFTHDSIGLGQDGPTHQPVEVLPMLRAIPNHIVFRPADGRETSGAYLWAVQSKKTPSSMILSRQDLPQLTGTDISKVALGAYVIQGDATPDVVLVGTGSEVSLMVEAAEKLKANLKVNVVSMPSWELFVRQSEEYRKTVFPDGIPVVSAEASSTFGWTSFAHYAVGMTTFGASAAAEEVYKLLKITSDNVAEKATKLVTKYGKQAPRLSLSLVGEEL
ncbi:transketolase [Naegleria gruberi]|uniref:transketolase n=1 Tax=Naegleria gruberi TaxID=5762 RepID=D2V4Z5_NAEGR|nr:transketolase [Naegleria gruberi]EFC48017.1 transketolase [Naegleria gruberi]|eukprot:XP_002680761.1 transketolase [Naegleria gruberi]